MSPSSTPIWDDNKLRELNLSPRLIYQKPAFAGLMNKPEGAVPEELTCPFHHQQ
ncbi:hypothetical protein D3C74_482490 [compost metagenome]